MEFFLKISEHFAECLQILLFLTPFFAYFYLKSYLFYT